MNNADLYRAKIIELLSWIDGKTFTVEELFEVKRITEVLENTVNAALLQRTGGES